ncbi:MAG: hypothetical protein ACK5NY_02865 [Burkholderiaceae bacterium]|jgi:hypothetical protein
MMHTIRFAALMCLGISGVTQAQTDLLGRLFFTQAERSVLETWRPTDGTSPDASPEPALMRLQGTVQSSSKQAWVIGKADGDATPPTTVQIGTGQAVVRTRTGSKSLKVGETIDLHSGQVTNPLSHKNGTIKTMPAPHSHR